MPNLFFLAYGGDAWLDGLNMQTIVAIGCILLALAFEFVNGFHDTANTAATVIYTKALKPGMAIWLSGIFNFLGALTVGTAVAQIVTKIIPLHTVNLSIVGAVLIAALAWNLFTWWLSIPVSSSHCLIGSLFGAGIMAAGINGVAWDELAKVVIALALSPIAGFLVGAMLTWLGMKLDKSTASINSIGDEQKNNQPVMRWLHVLACVLVAFSHGSNDGQKTMGIITLILATHFAAYNYTVNLVPLWVMIACAVAIGVGTTIGGWRIIKTVGTKISNLPITNAQGFGASMATALVILVASALGAPISTTHTLSSAVAGGTIPCHGIDQLNRKTIQNILLAWLVTVPVAAGLAAICYGMIHML